MAGQAIANPECLIDCFSKGSDYDSACFSSLTEDVATKGTCDTGDNPAHELDIWGWSELENNCVLEEVDYYDYYYGEYFSGSGHSGSGSGSGSRSHGDDDYSDYDYGYPMIITDGTCSKETEALLQTEACMKSLAEQPNRVAKTPSARQQC